MRIPVDPVRFCHRKNCQRLVCRSCAEAYMASSAYKDNKRACFWCRGDDANYIIEEKDALLVSESRDKELQLQAAASRFMEFYIFDFCFNVRLAARSAG